jgi:predicted RNase H-like HicB family nuclease
MKTITIIVERSEDFFGAYAENVEGIYGGGNTIEEVKQSILEAIELLKEYNKDENVPSILKGEYELVYKYDTESFLKYYKGILTNSAISRLSGINPTLIQHYASGLKKPRKAQREKLENALHAFGKELIEVRL